MPALDSVPLPPSGDTSWYDWATALDTDVRAAAEIVMDVLGTAGLVAGANVTLTYNDAANTITIASSAAGGGGMDAEAVLDLLGTTGLVAGSNITLNYNDAANTITIASTASGGLDAEGVMDLLGTTGLVEGSGIDIVYNDTAGTITVTADKTEMSLAAADVGLGNVTNVAQAPAARLLSGTAPVRINGGASGDLTADRTISVTTFSGGTPGVVPDGSAAGATAYLNGDGGWTTPTSTGAPVRRPLNAQTGTTYAPVVADENTMITLSNAAAITVTLPSNSTQAFPIASEVDFLWLGVGQPTFAAGSGATVNGTPGLKLRGRYSAATAKKIGTDAWVIVGDLAT